MFSSVGSMAFWKPSPPPTDIHIHWRIPSAPLRALLGPHHEPLSWRPTHTRYGRPMPADTWYARPMPHGVLRMDSPFSPPSHVMSTPPSLPYIACLLLSGSIQIAWLSTWPMLFRPWNVLPPSIDLHGPTPPTQMTSGLFGSTRSWLKYIGRWFWLET